MSKDIWHYPRRELAQQVLGMFNSGLSSALVFFAPRRMGKTEFLLKDMKPLAESNDWSVLYFSFLDVGSEPKRAFTLALMQFAVDIGATKWSKLQKYIKKVSAGVGGLQAGIELREPEQVSYSLKDIMAILAQYKSVLLLLDEVQVLACHEQNRDFIATLRTALDVNKDTIKVVFTGSSRQGLGNMFAQSDAPFFHFGQNLNLPDLGKDFTDHLAQVFCQTTGRQLDKQALWQAFQALDKIPQLIRSLVERMVLNPQLTIDEAQKQLMQEVVDERDYTSIWHQRSLLEQLLLKAIANGDRALFSQANRQYLADKMGIEDLPVSTVQSAIRSLQRQHIIGSLPKRGGYYIDDPNFESWIQRTVNVD